MTLIEVLAGLVILGTLLVSVSVARGRFVRQRAEADRRLAVVRAADAALARWLSGPPQNVPLRGEGTLDGAPGCGWTTRTVADPAAGRLGAVVVRAEFFDRSQSARGAREPLFGVEFLVHDFRKPVAPAAAAEAGSR